MSEFVLFNDRHMVDAFGFKNAGATCYFNAVIQSLLSCTSFNSGMVTLSRNPDYADNPIVHAYLRIISIDFSKKLTIEQKRTAVAGICPDIWAGVASYANSRDEKIRLNSGQQCAGEGFHILLQSLENAKPIQSLFEHRYKTNITCLKCNEVVSNKECSYSLFEIQPTMKMAQLEEFKELDDQYDVAVPMNKFLRKQNGYVEGFNCPKCNDAGDKFSEVNLVMVPEILVVQSKKYDMTKGLRKTKETTQFPPIINFNTRNDDGNVEYVYEAVAQIEHSGSLAGGHYWAVCKRKDGWYKLNDRSISPDKFKPTPNTYIVFYHIMSA
jgi:ubiquitin C-terminal hydrolase